MDEKERARVLSVALSQIEKQFGKGSVVRLGSTDAIVPVSAISSGSISVDWALGVGGFPRGRIVEVFGPESSGKTTIALQVVAEAQRAGGMAAFVDVEHALDPAYARKLGVDIDNLLVSQPDYAEQALEITNTLIASGSIDVLVVDSVAALVPKAELDGEMGDAFVGIQARLMSQAMRKLTGVVSKSNTCLMFINQIREKIGVMFGSPETTSGGRALKFYASVRADIRRIAAIKEGDVVIGNRTRVKIVKNKVAPPFKEAEFDILYGEGISREGDLLDLGAAQNVVEKSGSWFSYKGERIGQGRETARQFLKDNPDIRAKIDAELRRALGLVKPEKQENDAAEPAAPLAMKPVPVAAAGEQITVKGAAFAFTLALGGAIFAQLPAPNEAGVAMGHLHLTSKDPEAQRKFWIDTLGGTAVKLGNLDVYKFPDVLVMVRTGEPSGGSEGSVINHLGFKVKNLKTYTDKCAAGGYKITPNASNPQQAFITAPDAVKVELSEEPSMTAPIAHHHVHFFNTAVDETKAWYVKMFSAKPGRRGRFEAADLPGVNLSFSPAESATTPSKGRSVDHVGFEVRGLEAFARKLEAAGIKFEVPYRKVPALGIAIAFFTDPWGTYIELTEGLNKL